MDDPSDETLLDLYFLGDAQAFQEFYRRHSGRVVGFAKRKGLSAEAAEEIRQESFLRLHRSIHKYEHGRPALTWFFSIVHNCLVDAVRKNKRLTRLKAEFGQQDLAVPAATDNDSRVADALSALSAEQRRVVELRVLNDNSFKEIASTLAKNEVGLRKTFERAKEKMKRILLGSE